MNGDEVILADEQVERCCADLRLLLLGINTVKDDEIIAPIAVDLRPLIGPRSVLDSEGVKFELVGQESQVIAAGRREVEPERFARILPDAIDTIRVHVRLEVTLAVANYQLEHVPS